MAGSGVRTRYHIAINGKGFMLRGSPQNPAYIKQESAGAFSRYDMALLRDQSPNDPAYNPLNGADWLYWAQTDWSGGFQVLKFKDDGSFRDGQGIDTLSKYGQVTIQSKFANMATPISGSYVFNSYGVQNSALLIGVSKSNNSAKVFRFLVGSRSTLSSMVGISAVNGIARFKDTSLVAMTRTNEALSAKTLSKYLDVGGGTISGFRNANPVVRAVKGIGIRAYTAERVRSLSGDVLFYSTDLSTFTSAYQAGKQARITKIEELNGTPYFFTEDYNKVTMYRFDEYQSKAFPIYEFEDLTNYGVENYVSLLVVTGTANGESIAWAFNGSRIVQIFKDQLNDTSYDWRRPFVYRGRLHVKGALWDGQDWFPGLYDTTPAGGVYFPFANFGGKAVAYATSGSNLLIGLNEQGVYRASGYVVGSDFGNTLGYVDKMVNAGVINCKPLTSGQTIELFRSTDEGASFTSVGKLSYGVDGAISSKTLYYPSGFVAKKFTYKIQMASTVNTTTPTLKDIIHQYRRVPDSKARWTLTLQADDQIRLLNNQYEQRNGKELVSDLWLEKERKQVLVYEDVNACSAKFLSAMSKTATSALVSSTDHFPRRGRIRAVVSGVVEEMTYTSADGQKILGIQRGQKSTLARAYTSAHALDNYYMIVVTDVIESLNFTDEGKTESIAKVALLEA